MPTVSDRKWRQRRIKLIKNSNLRPDFNVKRSAPGLKLRMSASHILGKLGSRTSIYFSPEVQYCTLVVTDMPTCWLPEQRPSQGRSISGIAERPGCCVVEPCLPFRGEKGAAGQCRGNVGKPKPAGQSQKCAA